MSISYNVIPNALTNPPSFTARVAPNLVLDFDEMAVQINLHNPTIPVATAKSVLESFREEVKTQLLNGNTVKLTNFVSFVPTIPVNLAAATDPLPSSPLDIKAKPSTTFKNECNQAASYTRLGYPTKDPSITEAKDTSTEIIGFIEAGKGFRIDGRNLGFDPTNVNVGIFLKPGADPEERQTNISINDPSLIVITPSFTPEGNSDVEVLLTARNKYTENGTIRTGTYSRMLRTVVKVATGNQNYIFNAATASAAAEVSTWGGGTLRMYMQLSLDQLNILNLRVKAGAGEWTPYTQLTAEQEYTLTPAGYSIGITVLDLVSLTENVTAYGRFIQEVVDLTTIA